MGSTASEIFELAKKKEKEKSFLDAADLYEKAFMINTNDSNCLYRRGLCLERMKEFDSAVDAYSRAVDVDDPNWSHKKAQWYIRLGVVATKAKKKEIAKNAYQESIKLSELSVEELDVAKKLLDNLLSRFDARMRSCHFLSTNISEIRKSVSRDDNKFILHADPKIFVYWHDGFYNAPPVVQACVSRLEKNHGKEKIIKLNSKNWRYYVEIPEEVVERSSRVKIAHFTDVLRVALLSRYGGIWVDSTCFVTSNIIGSFDAYCPSDFFAFSKGDGLISNWFLASSCNNYISKMMYYSICEYWLKHEKVDHYFMFHHIFEVLYFMDGEFKRHWDSSVKKSSRTAHQLQGLMYEHVDNIDEIISKSMVHKLTHKFHSSDISIDSFVASFVRGEIV